MSNSNINALRSNIVTLAEQLDIELPEGFEKMRSYANLISVLSNLNNTIETEFTMTDDTTATDTTIDNTTEESTVTYPDGTHNPVRMTSFLAHFGFRSATEEEAGISPTFLSGLRFHVVPDAEGIFRIYFTPAFYRENRRACQQFLNHLRAAIIQVSKSEQGGKWEAKLIDALPKFLQIRHVKPKAQQRPYQAAAAAAASTPAYMNEN